MDINFQKIQGAGNDFVIFDNRNGTIELTSDQVQKICDRHFGVGADGIIEVRQSPHLECAAYMHYRNADGSLAEMCGNGVRCFARYLVEQNLLSEEEMSFRSFCVDTLAGIRPLSFGVDTKGNFTHAKVHMGEPAFSPLSIPTTLEKTQTLLLTTSEPENQRVEDAVVQVPVTVPMRTGSQAEQVEVKVTCVNMGNPHAVVFLEDTDEELAERFAGNPESIDLDTPGSYLEGKVELFPQKTNVELAVMTGTNTLKMRVYERGVGETLACGTGACAVALSAIIQNKASRDNPVTVEVSGGTLEVAWLPNNQVTLTGPAELVFKGTISLV